MDVQLTETQRLLANSAADWLKQRWPEAAARQYFDDRQLDESIWREVAEFGWAGLGVPEAVGGTGGSLGDVVALQEQLGVALFPTLIGSTLAAACALSRVPGATNEQVGRIARGEVSATVAVQEARGGFLTTPADTRIEPSGGGWLLRGEKRFVRDADTAQLLAVLARMANGELAWVLAPADADGVEVIPQEGSAHDGQAIVRFTNVSVNEARVVRIPEARFASEGLAIVMVLEAARLAGVGARAHRMAIQHATSRVQFGRPIGSFQAIQHKVADMTVDVESSLLAAHFAAFNLEHTNEGVLYALVAKLWASEAIQRVLREAHQVHGGVGYITEMSLHLYFRHAATGALLFGTPNELTAVIADHILANHSNGERP